MRTCGAWSRSGWPTGRPCATWCGSSRKCAERHEAVLEDPVVHVVFEDFGDNAQVFGLYFWINLTPSAGAAQVMSDIRFLIEE